MFIPSRNSLQDRVDELEVALDDLVNTLLRGSPGWLDTPAGQQALDVLTSKGSSAPSK